MVRAGPRGMAAARFETRCAVATGWYGVDWTRCADRAAVRDKLREVMPDAMRHGRDAVAGQIERFVRGMRIGEAVASYDARRRVFVIGRVTGQAVFVPDAPPWFAIERAVAWRGTAARDALSLGARKALGAMARLFVVPERIAAELEAACQQPAERAAIMATPRV